MIALIIISIGIGLISYVRYRKWSNPITIFSLMWAAIFALYAIKLFEYNEVSFRTQCVLGLQVVGFAVGGFFADTFPVRLKTRCNASTTKLRLKLVYVFCFITIIILLGDAAVVIEHLMKGDSLYDIADAGLITENDATGFLVIVKIFIVFPTVNCISAIGACEMLLKESKQKWFLFSLNLLIVLLYALQHGARHTLLTFVICYVLAYVISRKSDKLSRKVRFAVGVMCVFSVVFSVWLSTSRGIENVGISLYKYFAGIPPHLDNWITRVASSNEMTLGATASWGFVYPFFVLLRGLGVIRRIPGVLQTAYAFIDAPETATSIGANVGLNAHVGPAYAFYCDGRMLFVFLGLFAYGYACIHMYRKMQKNEGERSKAFYLFLMCTVCMSFIRFAFCSYDYGMAAWIFLLFYAKAKKGDQ